MKKILFALLFISSLNAGIKSVISSACNNVNYVHYDTIVDAQYNYYNDTRYLKSYPNRNILKPFWDIRYVNPVTKYENGGSYNYYPSHYKYTGLDTRYGYKNIGIGTSASRWDASGSISQSECIDGALAGGTTINMYDAPVQSLEYSGPQSTFKYEFGDNSVRPWKSNGTGNYMLQGRFDNPFWGRWDRKNIGGGVNFGVYLYNTRTGKRLSYIIGLYAFGMGRTNEVIDMQFDPTTDIPHISTVAKNNTIYATKSRWSKSIQGARRNMITYSHTKGSHWTDFFRVNITYDNLKAALSKVNIFSSRDRNPQDWVVESSMIQYELEEADKNGNGFKRATLTGSFWNFKTYITDKAW